jgi:tetratricopeptide (TPR) repeat protein
LRSSWRATILGLLITGVGAGPALAGEGETVTRLTHGLAQAESRSGAASPLLLPLLDRLAGAQFDDGDLAQAAAMRRRALKIALSTFGGNSVQAATAMTMLARLHTERHRYLDAEPLLIAAADILTARGGGDSAPMADVLAGQARIALARGDVTLAEASAGHAVAIAERDRPPRSTEPLRALGAVYASEERFEDGERVLRQALARDAAVNGAAGAETARSAAQLADLLVRQKRFDEALPLIEQAIAIDQSRLGTAHPLIADDFCDLGLIYEGLQRNGDARAAVVFAIGVLERGAGRETTRVAYAELELARILGEEGNDADAAIAFKDARRILNAVEDEERRRERQV